HSLTPLSSAPCAFCSRTLTSFSFLTPSTTQTYTLSLHDALPISSIFRVVLQLAAGLASKAIPHMPPISKSLVWSRTQNTRGSTRDRKSTRLNSSHGSISYAVFCLKKKKH